MHISIGEGSTAEFNRDQIADFGVISSCLVLVVECEDGSAIAAHFVLIPDSTNQKDFDHLMEELSQKTLGKIVKTAKLIGALDFWGPKSYKKIADRFINLEEYNTSNHPAIELTCQFDRIPTIVVKS